LILMLVARMRLSILAAASVIGFAFFVLNVALIGSNPVATFYLPFTRSWELLAGAAVASSWNQVNQSSAASNLRASIGLVLIATAAGFLDNKSAFPGWWAVLPVAGAALLLSAPAAWGCRHLLASRPLAWVGLVSYPLYLWHWPLLVFFGLIKFAPLTLLERGLIVGLSFVLAWLTLRRTHVPIGPSEPAQDSRSMRRNAPDRRFRRGYRRGAWVQCQAAARNSRNVVRRQLRRSGSAAADIGLG
jgi:peptidoglycan/LPS O-acetylase OafA/YrhL